MHAHCIIFLLFFCFFLIFFFFLAFILSFYFIIFFRVLPLFFRPLFWAQWRSSYSACRDQILLFCPLTTFVWSGCTCRPPLVHLHHPPPPVPDKENAVLFIGLLWRPFLSQCRHSLSIPYGMHLTVSPSTLPFSGGLSSQEDVLPKRA